MLPDKLQLDGLQQEFINNITDSSHNNELFLCQLDSKHLSAENQIDIYRRNYSGSIQKVLQQIYPACFNILGSEYFHTLCRDYSLLHAPTDKDLNTYGKYFNELLLAQCETNSLLNGYEYLHDLAVLEWHWHASYYSSNDTLFDFQKFSLLSSSQHSRVVFELSHTLSKHSSIYPVIDIWKNNRDTNATAAEYSIPGKPVNYCIFRQQLTLCIELIDDSLSQTINAIQYKIDLDSLCHYDNFDINITLPQLIKNGWVTGFTLRDEPC
ncbi:MAG: putative DNA-binding domain-containing protein [Gammaproteobacteria bacterium]|nr:putative DNA-binding domain-containing protein [Gammaproteobacteria bacterium]